MADGRDPSAYDTLVFRVEDGEWRDISGSAMPTAIPREWFFRFDAPGIEVPCGPYDRYQRRDGCGAAYKLGAETKKLYWEDNAFRAKPKG